MEHFNTMSDALDYFDQFFNLEPVSFVLDGGDAYTISFDDFRNAVVTAAEDDQ